MTSIECQYYVKEDRNGNGTEKAKDDHGEALGARRRKLAEEVTAITVSGKCRHRHQGDGSGRSTVDGRAAKRARREGPGPVSTPLVKVRQGEMTKAPSNLQELRRRIYRKAKSDQTHRFWGLFVHITKIETLEEAYRTAKRNGGAPGIDGQTFEDIERTGLPEFLASVREELITGRYKPKPNRRVDIPKGNGKFRTLQIPCIRDRVVQGAVKLILEAIFVALGKARKRGN